MSRRRPLLLRSRSALIIPALVGTVLVVFATLVATTYGWVLFVVLPVAVGFAAALEHHRAPGASGIGGAGMAIGAAVVSGFIILGAGVEGAICLIMAAPLALPLAGLGAALAYAVVRWRRRAARSLVSLVLVVVAPLQTGEAVLMREPALMHVSTSIAIAAPPEVVWRHVVTVGTLPPPTELVFRAGIAYPTGATIEGRGVGALRRCRFTTGEFVEPITAWDFPHKLAFDVLRQPAPMRELSPWEAVRAPHLAGFLQSERGAFTLERLPGGGTRLTGTTWYRNRMWPAAYWRLWSDRIIGKIHRRVLLHVEHLAEADGAAAATELLRAQSR